MTLYNIAQTIFISIASVCAIGSLIDVARVLRNSNKQMHAARATASK
jgi:hypothetical protein